MNIHTQFAHNDIDATGVLATSEGSACIIAVPLAVRSLEYLAAGEHSDVASPHIGDGRRQACAKPKRNATFAT